MAKVTTTATVKAAAPLKVAIVGFAVIIMMFVLLGTILHNQGGTVDTAVFPWEWGSSGD